MNFNVLLFNHHGFNRTTLAYHIGGCNLRMVVIPAVESFIGTFDDQYLDFHSTTAG